MNSNDIIAVSSRRSSSLQGFGLVTTVLIPVLAAILLIRALVLLRMGLLCFTLDTLLLSGAVGHIQHAVFHKNKPGSFFSFSDLITSGLAVCFAHAVTTCSSSDTLLWCMPQIGLFMLSGSENLLLAPCQLCSRLCTRRTLVPQAEMPHSKGYTQLYWNIACYLDMLKSLSVK